MACSSKLSYWGFIWDFSRQGKGTWSSFSAVFRSLYSVPVCVKAAWKSYETGHEASVVPCFVVFWWLVMTEGSLKGSFVGSINTDLPLPRGTQHPCKVNGQKWVKCVDWTFLSLSPFTGLFDHFVTAWGIRTITKLSDYRLSRELQSMLLVVKSFTTDRSTLFSS